MEAREKLDTRGVADHEADGPPTAEAVAASEPLDGVASQLLHAPGIDQLIKPGVSLEGLEAVLTAAHEDDQEFRVARAHSQIASLPAASIVRYMALSPLKMRILAIGWTEKDYDELVVMVTGDIDADDMAAFADDLRFVCDEGAALQEGPKAADDSEANLIKMFQDDSLQKAVAEALESVEDEAGHSGDKKDDAEVAIDDFLRNFLTSSVPAVGSDANVAKDSLAGDWRIDDATVIRFIKTPDAYRVEWIDTDTIADSADAIKDPESVAWVATLHGGAGCEAEAFTTYFTPMSDQVMAVLLDFGYGYVERFQAD